MEHAREAIESGWIPPKESPLLSHTPSPVLPSLEEVQEPQDYTDLINMLNAQAAAYEPDLLPTPSSTTTDPHPSLQDILDSAPPPSQAPTQARANQPIPSTSGTATTASSKGKGKANEVVPLPCRHATCRPANKRCGRDKAMCRPCCMEVFAETGIPCGCDDHKPRNQPAATRPTASTASSSAAPLRPTQPSATTTSKPNREPQFFTLVDQDERRDADSVRRTQQKEVREHKEMSKAADSTLLVYPWHDSERPKPLYLQNCLIGKTHLAFKSDFMERLGFPEGELNLYCHDISDWVAVSVDDRLVLDLSKNGLYVAGTPLVMDVLTILLEKRAESENIPPEVTPTPSPPNPSQKRTRDTPPTSGEKTKKSKRQKPVSQASHNLSPALSPMLIGLFVSHDDGNHHDSNHDNNHHLATPPPTHVPKASKPSKVKRNHLPCKEPIIISDSEDSSETASASNRIPPSTPKLRKAPKKQKTAVVSGVRRSPKKKHSFPKAWPFIYQYKTVAQCFRAMDRYKRGTLQGGVATVFKAFFKKACLQGVHGFIREDEKAELSQIPEVIQVSEHEFIEQLCLQDWRYDMLLAQKSGGNCAKVYNRASETWGLSSGWGYKGELRTERVYDGFKILSLLEFYIKHFEKQLLRPTHTGSQDQRFRDAMIEVNSHFQVHGQPEINHRFCDGCVRYWTMSTVKSRRCLSLSVMVSVTLGSGAACGVPKCEEVLENRRDFFCQKHASLKKECRIVGCSNPVRPGYRTCQIPRHVEAEEKVRRVDGQAAFVLKRRYETWTHSGESQEGGSEDQVGEEIDTASPEFRRAVGGVGVHGEAGVREDDPEGAIHGLFFRRMTHNEQAIIAPCGVFIARRTFNHHEAFSLVAQFFYETFVGRRVPNHFVYDTNCILSKYVRNESRPELKEFFKNVAQGNRHEYCNLNCNPYAFPELMARDEDNKLQWYFNTSIAEQKNAWIGGYMPMCREMSAVFYEFFLNIMIMLHNEDTVAKLEADGKNPSHW
ncbi:hypothetical protein VNI00_012189 [Paramarasmius palmivorus]|uniref:Uncharacterized protein n=1 Tax=Paramarasmius palmivorus TaxID=297713 RepID=A0AAW0C6X4_9AGAR